MEMQKTVYYTKKLVYIFIALLTATLCLFTMLYHAWSTPFPVIKGQNALILLCMALAQTLVYGLVYMAYSRFYSGNNKTIIFAVLLIYISIQLAFILLFPVKQNPLFDADKVVEYAKAILSGDYSAFEVGHYLNYFPNNIGITLFFSFLFKFLPQDIMTVRICNVLFSTLTTWLIYLLYKEVTHQNKNATGILLFSILFIPAILMNNLTYGDVISTTFCTGSMLCAIRFANTNRMSYAICTSLLLMTANFIRQNALLFFVAILFFWICKGISERKALLKKAVAGSVIAIVLFNLPLQVFSLIGCSTGVLKEPVGRHANPALRWVNIGFAYGDNIGYWDKGRNTKLFLKVFSSNPQKASHFFLKDIKKKYFKSGLKNVFIGYAKKTFWVWTEGTYMTHFYAFMCEEGKIPEYQYETSLTKFTKSADSSLITYIEWYLHSYNWIVMILVCFYLIYSIKKKDYSFELFIYVFMLYFGFYLIWEIKSRYLFGLYPIYILILYRAMTIIFCNKVGKQDAM